jgi:hypothetical protein
MALKKQTAQKNIECLIWNFFLDCGLWLYLANLVWHCWRLNFRLFDLVIVVPPFFPPLFHGWYKATSSGDSIRIKNLRHGMKYILERQSSGSFAIKFLTNLH